MQTDQGTTQFNQKMYPVLDQFRPRVKQKIEAIEPHDAQLSIGHPYIGIGQRVWFVVSANAKPMPHPADATGDQKFKKMAEKQEKLLTLTLADRGTRPVLTRQN